MAVVKSVKVKKDLSRKARNVENMKDDLVKKPYFLDKYKVSQSIEEDGEYFGIIKDIVSTDKRDFVRIQPYIFENGFHSYFEEVFINLNEVNSPSSAAGQFLTLFRKARHWGDIKDRVVGIEVKINEGDMGKVFKNVVRVFKSTADELVFDDAHMYDAEESNDDIVEETEDEEEIVSHQKKSRFVDEILDDEDEDYDDEEDEFEEE